LGGISGRLKLIFQLVLGGIVAAVFCNPLIEVQARSLYLPFFKIPVVLTWLADTDLLLSRGLVERKNLRTASTVSRPVARSPSVRDALFLPHYRIANISRSRSIRLGELTVICAALVARVWISSSIAIRRKSSWGHRGARNRRRDRRDRHFCKKSCFSPWSVGFSC
jgi:hypothetical protein